MDRFTPVGLLSRSACLSVANELGAIFSAVSRWVYVLGCVCDTVQVIPLLHTSVYTSKEPSVKLFNMLAHFHTKRRETVLTEQTMPKKTVH